MTNKELKERLDSAETSSEKKGIIEFMRDDIVNAAKSQMQFAEQFKRLLKIESIKLDVHF